MFRIMIQQAKKYPGLIPQFFFLVLGMGGAAVYLIRLAKGPHVRWCCQSLVKNGVGLPRSMTFFPTLSFLLMTWLDSWCHKTNPEPWNQVSPTYQYKFVAIETDYKNLKKEGPDF